MRHSLEVLNRKFRYIPDKKELWQYLDLTQDVVYGDCEDYVLTLQRELGKGDIYFCRISGWGHAVLELDGKWIDCNTKGWVTSFGGNYTSFKKYSWLRVKWKVFKGRIRKLLS